MIWTTLTWPAFYHLPNSYMSEPWNHHCNAVSEIQEWMGLGARRKGALTVLIFISCLLWLCWCLEHLSFAPGSSENTYYLGKHRKGSDYYAQLPWLSSHYYFLSGLLQQKYLMWLGCWQTLSVVIPPSAPVSSNQALWALLPIYSVPSYLTTSTNVC